MTENKNSKPPTVACITKNENGAKCLNWVERVRNSSLVYNPNLEIKAELIRRKDAEDEKNKCYEAGYKNGKRQGKKDVLELIEEMMGIDQMNPEMTDEALKKERLFALRELKQKLEDGKE